MQSSLATTVFAILIVVVLLAVFLFFYFRSVRKEIAEYWLLVLQKLRLRLDKIPMLVETVRTAMDVSGADIDRTVVNELIKLRSDCWPMTDPDKNKIQRELMISQLIHNVLDLAKNIPDVNRDVQFLSLKKDFSELGKEIEKMLEWYNNKVRHFNSLRNSILLRPFMMVFHYGKMITFEFEA